MACCICNRSGCCRNCNCVKNGSLYRGCIPQRLEKCVNTLYTPPPFDQTSTSPQFTENSSTGRRSSSPSPHFLDTGNATSRPGSTPVPSHPIADSLSYPSRVPETPPPCLSAPELLPSLSAPEPLLRLTTPESPLELSTGAQTILPLSSPLWIQYMLRSFIGNQTFSRSALECIAAVVLPILMLQKPSTKSKAKKHIACLERRLKMWQEGDLSDLLLEGRTIMAREWQSSWEAALKEVHR